MNKFIILIVIAVLAFLGWTFYEKNKTITTYVPKTSTQEVSANQDIETEVQNIDEGLNSTDETDFNPSNFSDISQ